MHWTVAWAMVAQVEHDVTYEDNEYEPAAQVVHVVAPALAPVFVTDPAPQFEHEATFDDDEYRPGVQREHVVAPPLVPVSVIDPAPHHEHARLLPAAVPVLYVPAMQVTAVHPVARSELHAVHVP